MSFSYWIGAKEATKDSNEQEQWMLDLRAQVFNVLKVFNDFNVISEMFECAISGRLRWNF